MGGPNVLHLQWLTGIKTQSPLRTRETGCSIIVCFVLQWGVSAASSDIMSRDHSYSMWKSTEGCSIAKSCVYVPLGNYCVSSELGKVSGYIQITHYLKEVPVLTDHSFMLICFTPHYHIDAPITTSILQLWIHKGWMTQCRTLRWEILGDESLFLQTCGPCAKWMTIVLPTLNSASIWNALFHVKKKLASELIQSVNEIVLRIKKFEQKPEGPWEVIWVSTERNSEEVWAEYIGAPEGITLGKAKLEVGRAGEPKIKVYEKGAYKCFIDGIKAKNSKAADLLNSRISICLWFYFSLLHKLTYSHKPMSVLPLYVCLQPNTYFSQPSDCESPQVIEL